MADQLDFSSQASAVDPSTLDFSAQASSPGQDAKTLTVTAKRGSTPGDESLGSDWQNYLAGIGKAVVDTGRGAAQTVAGTVAQAIEPTRQLYARFSPDVAQTLGQPAAINQALKEQQSAADERDAPLLGTKAGLAGDITGNAALVLAPGAALKGARAAGLPGVASESALSRALLPESVRGATIQGAVQGGAQPLNADQPDEDRTTNAAIGAVAGGGGALIPRAIGSVVRGGRALVAPFTESGRASILADLANRFGITAPNITPSAIPGVKPTLAEATGSPNAANFQRSLLNQPGAQDAFAERAAANNAARYNYLRNAVGTPESIAALQDTRQAVSSPLYDLARTIDDTQRAAAAKVIAGANASAQQDAAAQAATIRAQGRLIPGYQQTAETAAQAAEKAAPTYQLEAHPAIQSLMNRPVFAQAVNVAKTALQDAGRSDLAADPLQSLDGLQKVKWALDQGVNQAEGTPLRNADKATIASIKNQFMAATNQLSPAFQAANEQYAAHSAPITAQEVGQELLRRGTSAAEDVNGVPQVQRAKLAGALRNADTIAQNVTGQKSATEASTLTPEQSNAFRSVLYDLARGAQAQGGSLPPGSPTVQNAISQNVLGSIGAVPGLSGVTAIGPLARVASALDKAFKATDIPDKLQAEAREFALNPTSPTAQRILEKLTPSQRSALEQIATPYTAQGAQGVRQSLQQ